MFYTLVIIGILYLLLIFLAAWFFERKLSNSAFKSWMPYVYSLALAVYCTAWTFYGSIGIAAQSGLSFILIYLGPTLALFLWYPFSKKLFRLKNSQGISSLADFLAARYGKSQALGALVALLSLFGILPYISLQIKAISESFSFLVQAETNPCLNASDPALYISLVMIVFTIAFGTRYVQGNRPKAGLIGTIAFESLFKLIAFVVVGIVALKSFFKHPEFNNTWEKFQSLSLEMEGSEWMSTLLISALAFMLLPRQFQMGVVENNSEKNISKALWLFPLYLLILNIFVLPFAFMGQALSPDVNSDFYLLSVSKILSGDALASLAFLGGLSASTSMIIVSTLALGNMMSTYLLVPYFAVKNQPSTQRIINLRRIAISSIIVLAYLYYRFIALATPLVSIGLISFVAVSQFAPAFIIGLYWREAKRQAAFWSISLGFLLWFYFLVLPNIAQVLGFTSWLGSPYSPAMLANSMGLSVLSAASILSLSLNALLFLFLSLRLQSTVEEQNQALLFVEAEKFGSKENGPSLYQGSAPFPNVKALLVNFLGASRTDEVLERYARLNSIDWLASPMADGRMIGYAERLLSETIGPASAKIMIASVVQKEQLSQSEVLSILEESKKVLLLNKELSTRSRELKKATDKLQEANDKLLEFAELKDEFLYTVTHELRTPLTAIRSQAELLQDDPDIPLQDRQMFLDNMVADCDRLTRLISNVLDLEKFESGNQKLVLNKVQIGGLVENATANYQAMARKQNINLSCKVDASLLPTYADADRISQVITNLIGNALKFASADGGVVKVLAKQQANGIQVSIYDNGLGIPEADREIIFDKFYQVRNQTRRKPSGSGLGLAICKNIILMHRGEIWVEVPVDGGTTLCFTLPHYQETHTRAKVYVE